MEHGLKLRTRFTSIDGHENRGHNKYYCSRPHLQRGIEFWEYRWLRRERNGENRIFVQTKTDAERKNVLSKKNKNSDFYIN